VTPRLPAGPGGDPCNGSCRDGSYAYQVGEKIRSDDAKAVGPLVLAGLEMETKETR
jgi:unsaturated rhamnogalacturonyl hydrolase